jgi:Spy/CpxP family protein refolding chaperone
MEHLNLTEDQQKQIAALEAEVKAKLEKILTPEQLQQLKQMRPPGRPGGPGGEGHPQPPPPEQ